MGHAQSASHPEACALCGLPTRFGDFRLDAHGRTLRFCCMGCKQVFTLLMEATGSADPAAFRRTDLFRTCQDMGIIPRSEADLERSASPDAPAPEPAPASEGAPGPTDAALPLHLSVRNMWCPSCAWVIQEILRRTPGVENPMCSFSTDRVRCTYNPLRTSPPEIIRVIEGLGYRAALPGEPGASREARREFIRFLFSAFLTVNVMMLSFALYSGFFTRLSDDTIWKLSWPIFVMASGVLFYGGRPIYTRAWAGLFTAALGMETLITLGAFSAYLYSVLNLISGSIHLYFDTASMLVTLVLLGKTLERRAKAGVTEGLESFFSLRPTKVKICTPRFPDGRYGSADQLAPGDLFRVDEGEILPADGIVTEGTGTLDESSLTGEALPVGRKPGDRVLSGTRVLRGPFKVRAESVGEGATLGQMIRIMERALEQETDLEGRTDRLLRWFVPIILALALGTGMAGLLYGLSVEDAFIRSITVLVISCPCALGIAIPLARVAGISLSGTRGILVRDFSAFEAAEQVDTVVLDKTGTVTHGNWTLRRILPLASLSQDRVLALAAGLEQDANHYIAEEIRRRAAQDGIAPEHVSRIRAYENGVTGRLDGQEVRIGSRDFLSEAFESFSDKEAESPEYSHVYMSLEGTPCALLQFGDCIREGAPRVIGRLREKGLWTVLISGDGETTTAAVGQKIGTHEAHGGKRPAEKAAFIRGLQEQGKRVAMVGDGINDAPALVQADLAMAVHAGSHLGKEAADITLMRGEPEQILDFLDLGRQVNRKISQNLGCSFVYNVIAVPVAMTGLLSPLIAVTAMLLSSLSVIGNTLLLIRRHHPAHNAAKEPVA